MKSKGYIFGRLIVTTCTQAANAPLMDQSWTRAEAKPGAVYRGICILLAPWRRRYGQRVPQRALIIGWQVA